MEPAVYGAQVPYMPDRVQSIVNAGVGVYELRVRGKEYWNKTMMGPYNCRVTEFNEPGQYRRPRVEFITGFSASLLWDADPKTGNCIAWMVDDPWMHNRLHLMLDPWMLPMAQQRHTGQGIIPGYIIRLEVQAMKSVLRQTKAMFDVLQDGRYIDHFTTEAEANEFIDSKQTYELKADKTGQLRNIPMNHRKYSIRKGKLEEFKPEIKSLIDRYKNLQYGWTACNEFKVDIKPLIAKELENLKASAEPPKAAVAPEDLAGAISKWTPEERARFNKLMMGEKPELEPANTVHEEPAEVANPEDQDPVAAELAAEAEGQPEAEPVKKNKGGRPKKQPIAVQ